MFTLLEQQFLFSFSLTISIVIILSIFDLCIWWRSSVCVCVSTIAIMRQWVCCWFQISMPALNGYISQVYIYMTFCLLLCPILQWTHSKCSFHALSFEEHGYLVLCICVYFRCPGIYEKVVKVYFLLIFLCIPFTIQTSIVLFYRLTYFFFFICTCFVTKLIGWLSAYVFTTTYYYLLYTL